MAVKIVTGRRGEAHITSDEIKAQNIEAFGNGKFVFDIAPHLWPEKLSASDNTHIKINSGMLMSHGVQMGVEFDGVGVTLELDSGIPGYQRYDLVVMRYTRNTELDIENAELVVKKGTPVVIGNPVPIPEYVDHEPLKGAIEDETPICKLFFDGATLIEPTKDDFLLESRTGFQYTGKDDEDPTELNPSSRYVITEATIDKLWGHGLVDGDAGRY